MIEDKCIEINTVKLTCWKVWPFKVWNGAFIEFPHIVGPNRDSFIVYQNV